MLYDFDNNIYLRFWNKLDYFNIEQNSFTYSKINRKPKSTYGNSIKLFMDGHFSQYSTKSIDSCVTLFDDHIRIKVKG